MRAVVGAFFVEEETVEENVEYAQHGGKDGKGKGEFVFLQGMWI